MAKSKNYAVPMAMDVPKGIDSYQCEEDVRTLTRAAEVLADKGRKKMAMGKFKKTQVEVGKLIGVLSNNRTRRYATR